MVASIFASQQPAFGGLDPDAAALIARMTTPPDATRIQAINTYILALKAGSVWDQLECLWVFAAADAQAALLNWKAATFTPNPVNSPVFTADRGYAGDGSTSYLDTTWVPSASSIFLQDSGCAGVYLNAGDITGINTAYAGGTMFATSAVLIGPRSTTDTLRGRCNSNTTSNSVLASTTRLGMTHVQRPGSVLDQFSKNGSNLSNVSFGSSLRSNVSMFLGAYRSTALTPAGFVNNRIAVAYAGAQLSNARITAFYAATLAYLTPIGAN